VRAEGLARFRPSSWPFNLSPWTRERDHYISGQQAMVEGTRIVAVVALMATHENRLTAVLRRGPDIRWISGDPCRSIAADLVL